MTGFLQNTWNMDRQLSTDANVSLFWGLPLVVGLPLLVGVQIGDAICVCVNLGCVRSGVEILGLHICVVWLWRPSPPVFHCLRAV